MRTEKDFLGEVKVPKRAYYGSFTARAMNNFHISGITWDSHYIEAMGKIKIACAEANYDFKVITKKQKDAIVKACKEIIKGKFHEEFVLDIFQAGAGTPFHMNANEVIANRANELLKGKKGDYKFVHPNDHVNASQSTNNIVPSAIKLGALEMLTSLRKELTSLSQSFSDKAARYKNLNKLGRTHLQDAVPIMWRDVFRAYKEYIDRSLAKIDHAEHFLKELGIGGTATGNGIAAPKEFTKKSVKYLNVLTKGKYYASNNKVYLTQSHESFLELANALKFLSFSLEKISNDLILLSSGPRGGFNEIVLPEVEPGSSIMPGKVNPSIPECMRMVCYQVEGNCRAIERAITSELELNINAPVSAYNIYFAINILTNAIHSFRKCVGGLKVNKSDNLAKSTALATLFKPSLGYKVVSDIVREAIKNNKDFIDVLRSKKIIKDKAVDKIIRGGG
jgi:aspartate ammonia-lyase